MTDKSSFDQLPQLLSQLATAPCIVVATKCDLVQSWAVTLVRQQTFRLHQTCLVHSALGHVKQQHQVAFPPQAQVQQVVVEHRVPLFLMANKASANDSPSLQDQCQSTAHAILSKITSLVDASLW